MPFKSAYRIMICQAFLFMILFFTGCSSSLPNAVENIESNRNSTGVIDEYLNNFIDFFDAESATRSQIINELGLPFESKETKFENSHDQNQLDVYETMLYKNLELTIFKVQNSEQIIVVNMVITGPEYIFKGGIKIGDQVSDIIGLLGKPTEQYGQEGLHVDKYCDSFTGQTCLAFHSSQETIKKITYESYLD